MTTLNCIWTQKSSGVWKTTCGRKMMWLMDICPACRRTVSECCKGDNMKMCTRCGYKPESEFNVDRHKRDGLQTQCRECKHKAQKRDYALKAETYMDRQKKRRKANPSQKRAHNAVARAIKSGKMNRPAECSRCGNSRQRIEAHHHNGYEGPAILDVVFLCTSCHRREEAYTTIDRPAAKS